MPQYTTGEIARLCNVTVRTVQYYDSRGILTPSALSEGGRRLYSEDDLNRMKIICFLRNLELPIDSIKALLREEHPENVISMMLQEQEKQLRSEISEKQQRLETLQEVKRTLRLLPRVSVGAIGDIANIMQGKQKLRRLRLWMLSVGAVMDIIEIGTVVWWVKTGNWIPFAMGMGIVALLGIWITRRYFGSVSYICPECHQVFRPVFREAFFAWHTPYTRKLTCTRCGHHGFCVETYNQEEPKC